MGDKEAMEKGTEKKVGVGAVVQILLMVAAMVLAVIGIVRNTNILRIVIYVWQCLAGMLILVFGVLQFKDADRKIFRWILYSYALLEGVRSVLLNTIGVNHVVGAFAKLILVALACTCVLMAERLNDASGIKVAIGLVVLEVILYLVFLIGFPGVLLGRLNRFLPMVGVLIAVNIALVQKRSYHE